MLWALGALLTSFYLANFFNETKSDIRQEYNANYDLAFTFMRSITNLLRDIQYITEKHLSQRTEKDLAIIPPQYDNNTVSYTSLSTNSDCDLLHNKSHNY